MTQRFNLDVFSFDSAFVGMWKSFGQSPFPNNQLRKFYYIVTPIAVTNRNQCSLTDLFFDELHALLSPQMKAGDVIKT
ncbi:hypothetical protein Bhyg_01833 [Pseudolycoriella hygida]|uniref:Uncharacterized protein n=1 Tax=Pseudolycoriella hygida TaxID=35572 RepID=A0A9Q0NA92_9DIPT|nr:hypothetical protein Bhyg_01833 [Pseudolycoriella hygida]